MTPPGQRVAPDTALFEALAMQAIADLPPAFRAQVGDVVVQVAEFADDEQLASVGLTDPWELTGLYTGIPLDAKSAFDVAMQPDMVHLFRQPLLAEWCDTGVDLADLVNHVVVHEIGHHFGLSDDDMHALEDEAE